MLSARLLGLAALVLLGSVTACGNESSGSSGSSAKAYDVKAGDRSCDVERTSIDAGRVVFEVENVGSDVTEVYVYGKSGDEFTTIIGERENIGPGTSQRLEVNLAAGEYQVACKPGMTGDGIRTPVTVTGSGGAGDDSAAGYDRELEFHVRADGSVARPQDLHAVAGEKVEVKLENESTTEYYVELVAPNGSELGEGEAAGGRDAEFVSKVATPGKYTVRIYPEGQEAKADSSTLSVSR